MQKIRSIGTGQFVKINASSKTLIILSIEYEQYLSEVYFTELYFKMMAHYCLPGRLH
jgi:hypothetical protein